MEQSKNQPILGIDLGTTYVGLALKRGQRSVEELQSFSYKDQFQLVEKLEQVIREFDISVVVVGDMGLPKFPDFLQRSLDKIATDCNVSVVVVPEFLSTFQAEKEIHESGGKSVHSSGHSRSAVQILEEYLQTAERV